MSVKNIELTQEQFGVFGLINEPTVTDVDYDGSCLWVTDLIKGCYKAEEHVSEEFINTFTHNVKNKTNEPFTPVRSTLEAAVNDLRIIMVHPAAAASGTAICVRKSPPTVRNTIEGMVDSEYCQKEILHLLINCVRAKMNFVFGGEPGTGKTECAKFFMQFIEENEKVVTIEDVLEMHYKRIYPGRNGIELLITKDFTYQDAIKVCLRVNPEWLMLAEARSKEVKFLMEQWSTGVHGFCTVHFEDIRNLPDRILNMMEHVSDPERMENRIYRAVNIGILIRRVKNPDGSIRRYIDQMGFYTREDHKNKVYMIVDEAKIVSRELPEDIKRKFRYAGIKNPFVCERMDEFLRKEKERYEQKNESEEYNPKDE